MESFVLDSLFSFALMCTTGGDEVVSEDMSPMVEETGDLLSTSSFGTTIGDHRFLIGLRRAGDKSDVDGVATGLAIGENKSRSCATDLLSPSSGGGIVTLKPPFVGHFADTDGDVRG
mmetsp:Transcript_25247/g.47833  ORF Transcript_25247/g.47833 Transcript_25247/m.47833 type:complete len:117 (-) Transcript_25247:1800-2150(-)